MDDRQPSQTALAAAAARAAHPVVDREPLIFRDPVAADLIGEPGAEMVGYHRRSGDHIVLAGTRAQVTVRSHYTERRLAEPGRPTVLDLRLRQLRRLGCGHHPDPTAITRSVVEVGPRSWGRACGG